MKEGEIQIGSESEMRLSVTETKLRREAIVPRIKLRIQEDIQINPGITHLEIVIVSTMLRILPEKRIAIDITSVHEAVRHNLFTLAD